MKKIISTILLGSISVLNAQIIIGDAIGTATTKTSVLLEFATNQNKGIILPYVRTLPVTPAEGTILLDASTSAAARVKVYNANATAGANGWLDLSGQNANVTTALSAQPTIAVAPEDVGSKSIIGSVTSSADGVLVLESTTKAMVLPVVADVQNIPSPSPGMMVYVNKAGGKRLAVFNGSVWSFWRGEILGVSTVTTATGRIWMDRNLGATQVATSSNDSAAYGGLYQWGRLADGHQLRTSPSSVVNATSNTDVPGNGNFIVTNASPLDWRAPQNNNLWQGVNGVNNPCPSGFRLPTAAEFDAERATWSSQDNVGAFLSPLKIPASGYRDVNGLLQPIGVFLFWTSSTNGQNSLYVEADSEYDVQRGYGMSVRCIKN